MKSTSTLRPPAEAAPATNEAKEPDRLEVLKQLEKITTSVHFRNSKRYPTLLRFVVEHTLAGRTDVLKERTLGTEVFGKPSGYDTNADPIVRVTAGEIRKRLAQYYQSEGCEHDLRIELPLGSYVPHFFVVHTFAPEDTRPHSREAGDATHVVDPEDGPAEDVAAVPEQDPIPADPPSSRSFRIVRKPSLKAFSSVLLLCSILLVAGVALGVRLWNGRAREAGIAYFWSSILSSENPALIVIGVHSLDMNGRDLSPRTYASSPSQEEQSMLSSMIYSDMVPISDIISYSELTKLLTQRSHSYRTQGAAETTFGQLQRGPVILLGGLDNVWTIRLTSSLRYRFGPPNSMLKEIVDSKQAGTSWKFDNAQSALGNSRDYAIVASFFSPEVEQRVLIAAGIGKSGTAAATEFLTSDKDLQAWVSQSRSAKSKNVEIVLSTEIVEGQQGPPHIVAGYSW